MAKSNSDKLLETILAAFDARFAKPLRTARRNSAPQKSRPVGDSGHNRWASANSTLWVAVLPPSPLNAAQLLSTRPIPQLGAVASFTCINVCLTERFRLTSTILSIQRSTPRGFDGIVEASRIFGKTPTGSCVRLKTSAETGTTFPVLKLLKFSSNFLEDLLQVLSSESKFA